MNALDFPRITKFGVGFDRMFEDLATLANRGVDNPYPPYNLVKVSDDQYQIQIAVAGFTKADLDISTKDGVLTVTGNQANEDTAEYIYRGIARRNFVRTFRLAEYVEVTDATVEDGMLVINMKRELPEVMKPRQIAIR